jgi:hypothetical protein
MEFVYSPQQSYAQPRSHDEARTRGQISICTHNAYHVGQIVYVRKLQGSWNPEKGVK